MEEVVNSPDSQSGDYGFEPRYGYGAAGVLELRERLCNSRQADHLCPRANPEASGEAPATNGPIVYR
jgi:hypothetical protein